MAGVRQGWESWVLRRILEWQRKDSPQSKKQTGRTKRRRCCETGAHRDINIAAQKPPDYPQKSVGDIFLCPVGGGPNEDKLAHTLGGSCSPAKRQITSESCGERHADCACAPVPNTRQCHKCETNSNENAVSTRESEGGECGGGEGKWAEGEGGEPRVSQDHRSPTLCPPGDGMRWGGGTRRRFFFFPGPTIQWLMVAWVLSWCAKRENGVGRKIPWFLVVGASTGNSCWASGFRRFRGAMELVSGQGEWEDQQAQRLPGRPLWSPESQGGASWVALAAGVPLPECTCGVPCWCWFGDGGDVGLPRIRLLPCVLTRKNWNSTGAGPRSGQQRVVGAAHRAAPGMLRSTFSLTVEGPGGQRAAKIPHKEVLPLVKDKAWRRRASPTQNLGNHRVPGQNGPF